MNRENLQKSRCFSDGIMMDLPEDMGESEGKDAKK